MEHPYLIPKDDGEAIVIAFEIGTSGLFGLILHWSHPVFVHVLSDTRRLVRNGVNRVLCRRTMWWGLQFGKHWRTGNNERRDEGKVEWRGNSPCWGTMWRGLQFGRRWWTGNNERRDEGKVEWRGNSPLVIYFLLCLEVQLLQVLIYEGRSWVTSVQTLKSFDDGGVERWEGSWSIGRRYQLVDLELFALTGTQPLRFMTLKLATPLTDNTTLLAHLVWASTVWCTRT